MSRLIQLNTLGGALTRPLLQFFEQQKPDVLMLQEVLSSPEGRTFYFDFLQRTQKQTGMEHVFFTPVLDHVHGLKRTYFGTAILAHHAFEKTYDEFMHLGYKKDWDAEIDSDDMKAMQHAVMRMPSGKHVNLINYHGLNVKKVNKQGNDDTGKHCRRIAEYARNLDGPVILSGDFNLAPEAKSLQPINAVLRNLCIENKVGTTRNQFAGDKTTVDYIWVSRDVTVRHFEVLPDLVSDHAALLLEFDI